jgi:hypothetical protein
MSYALTTIEKPGYLHFRVTGRNSVAAVRGYLGDIHAACAQRGCGAVLIEENLGGPSLDIGAIFGIASAGSAATAPVMRMIAYVDVNPDHDASKMRFAETVAVTRGINIRMFATVETAERWLRDCLAGEAPHGRRSAPPRQEDS